LFSVVNASDDSAIFNTNTRQYVSVASISPTAIGSGFGTVNLTLTFNTPVPPSLQYKVYYGRRVTVATLPVELSSNPIIRRSPNRVRFPEFDRTGYGPTSISPDQDYTATYPDPYLAQWKATFRGISSVSNTYDAAYSGAIGYLHIGSRKNKSGVADHSLISVAGAACLYAYEKDIRSSLFSDGTLALTKIDSTLAASVMTNNIVILNAADYLYVGSGTYSTAIRLGVDMLEITFTNGSKKVVIITAFGANPRQAIVCTLGGANPAFGVPPTAVTSVKWIRPSFYAGGAIEEATLGVAGGPVDFRGGAHLASGAISDSPIAEIAQSSFFFAAGTSHLARAGTGWNLEAMTWGSYQDTSNSPTTLGSKIIAGKLLGDGSVESFGGRIKGFYSKRSNSYYLITTSSAQFWDPHLESLLAIKFVNSTNKTLTLSFDSTYTPQDGDVIELMVCNSDTSGSGGLSSIVWPATFVFSGTDGDVTGVAVGDIYMKFIGTYLDGLFFFTRTDYEV
jgi:hypothetical protein